MLRPAERRRIEPRRMQRREAVNLVGAAFLKHADVVTLRVGSPRADGSVTPPGHDRLAEETGLSLTRLRRAIAEGVRAGWWTASQPRLRYRGADGEWAYAAFRVIYRLSEKFFRVLGLGPKLQRERVKASERLGQRRRIYALALLAARDSFRTLRRGLDLARRTDIDAAENRGRLLTELRLRLRQQYPGWPPERIEAEAQRLAGR
jgi:hypothetical protein